MRRANDRRRPGLRRRGHSRGADLRGFRDATQVHSSLPLPPSFSIQRIDIAGRDVTRYLRLLLRKEGINFHRSSEFEIVREIKERACYVSTNPVKEESSESEKVRDTSSSTH